MEDKIIRDFVLFLLDRKLLTMKTIFNKVIHIKLQLRRNWPAADSAVKEL